MLIQLPETEAGRKREASSVLTKLERDRDAANARALDADAKVRRAFRGAAEAKKQIAAIEESTPPPAVKTPTKKRAVAGKG